MRATRYTWPEWGAPGPEDVKNDTYWCTFTFRIDFWHFQSHTIETPHCFDVLKLYFRLGLAHSRTKNGNTVIKMKI